MAKLTVSDVKHVAKLANLTLTDDEIAKFTPQLEKIVDYISQLKDVDTTGIEPTSQTNGLVNVTRDDSVKSVDLKIENYYEVDQILKNRTNE